MRRRRRRCDSATGPCSIFCRTHAARRTAAEPCTQTQCPARSPSQPGRAAAARVRRRRSRPMPIACRKADAAACHTGRYRWRAPPAQPESHVSACVPGPAVPQSPCVPGRTRVSHQEALRAPDKRRPARVQPPACPRAPAPLQTPSARRPHVWTGTAARRHAGARAVHAAARHAGAHARPGGMQVRVQWRGTRAVGRGGLTAATDTQHRSRGQWKPHRHRGTCRRTGQQGLSDLRTHAALGLVAEHSGPARVSHMRHVWRGAASRVAGAGRGRGLLPGCGPGPGGGAPLPGLVRPGHAC